MIAHFTVDLEHNVASLRLSWDGGEVSVAAGNRVSHRIDAKETEQAKKAKRDAKKELLKTWLGWRPLNKQGAPVEDPRFTKRDYCLVLAAALASENNELPTRVRRIPEVEISPIPQWGDLRDVQRKIKRRFVTGCLTPVSAGYRIEKGTSGYQLIWVARESLEVRYEDESSCRVWLDRQHGKSSGADHERPPQKVPDESSPETLPARSIPRLDRIWQVPELRNPHFCGRSDLLKDLHRTLNEEHTMAVTQAISGLGGIGKTQLALEYAYRHSESYELVWWLAAEETKALEEGLAKLASRVGVTTPEGTHHQQALEWIQQQSNWLLIYDNAMNAMSIRQLLPRRHGRCTRGHVIITSRDRIWGGTAKLVNVKVLSRSESVELLQKRSSSNETLDSADSLAATLGDLPLALTQAAAYLESRRCPPSQYLWHFARHRDALAKFNDGSPESTYFRTWTINFENLAEESAAAIELLEISSFMDPTGTPIELFRSNVDALPPTLQSASSDDMRFEEVISQVTRHSLMERLPGERLTMHRVVQAITRDRLSPQTRVQTAMAALELLRRHHLGLHCVEDERPRQRAIDVDGPTVDYVDLLTSMGDVLVQVGKLQRALELYSESARLADDIEDPLRLASATLRMGALGRSIEVGGYNETQVKFIRRALRTLPVAGHAEQHARLKAMLAMSLSYHRWNETIAEREREVEEARELAESDSDESVRAYVLFAKHWSLWSPDNLEERLTLSSEMVRLAGVGSEEPDQMARLYLHMKIIDMLEQGEFAEATALQTIYEETVERLGQPPLYTPMYAALLAILRGQFDDARRSIQRCYSIGGKLGDPNVDQTLDAQLFVLHWLQGRMSEFKEVLASYTKAYSSLPSWRAAYALSLHEGNEVDAAREHLRELIEPASLGFSRDFLWLARVVLISELALRLRDVEAMQAAYAALAPYAGRWAIVGYAAACLGPVDRALGALAAALGRREEAETHLTAALEASERAGAEAMFLLASCDYLKVHAPAEPELALPEWRSRLARTRERARALGLEVVLDVVRRWPEDRWSR